MPDFTNKLKNPDTETLKADSMNYFKSVLKTAKDLQLPVAFWKLPYEQEINGIVGFIKSPQIGKIHPSTDGPGFCLAPFINPEGTNTQFIPAHFHFTKTTNEKIEESRTQINSELSEKFKSTLTANLKSEGKGKTVNQKDFYSQNQKTDQSSDENYLNIVRKAIKYIHDEQFEKVVPARSKRIPLPDTFDPVFNLKQLCITYPSSFVSLCYTPESGILIGASPEILVSVDKNGVFKTVALAGTQKYDDTTPPKDARWSQKDIEEQAMVSRYIINCFKKIRLREFNEKGPKTIVAGNLLHLCTEYTVNTRSKDFANPVDSMLELLHPTSAVCGMPKAPAEKFILENENHDRGFYGGYLGPVGLQGESHLFVNLRCMRINNGSAELFAGAGILAESVPEKELAETEMKMNTLLRVMTH